MVYIYLCIEFPCPGTASAGGEHEKNRGWSDRGDPVIYLQGKTRIPSRRRNIAVLSQEDEKIEQISGICFARGGLIVFHFRRPPEKRR